MSAGNLSGCILGKSPKINEELRLATEWEGEIMGSVEPQVNGALVCDLTPELSEAVRQLVQVNHRWQGDTVGSRPILSV